MDSSDPIDLAVGARIRIRRKLLKVSQTALGDHLGISFQQVQKYERGDNRISASMLVRTAVKLETTVADLVGETQGAVADGEVLGMLAPAGALDLLQAFAGVDNPRVRAAILELVRTTCARDQASVQKVAG
jgi:transcriptional regulator with XRE-family HTH domain